MTAVCTLSFLLSALAAFLMTKFALPLGLVDLPNERSSHCTETPKGGGIGIVAAFATVSFFENLDASMWLPPAGVALMALAGDRLDLSPKLRLPAQLLLAVLTVAGIQLPNLPAFPFIALALFWVVFIVGTANFYNFMDGINGIAAIAGIVGFGLMALQNMLGGEHQIYTSISLAMTAGCLGFLPFNFPIARVFMGDVGSVLLGFVFAYLVASISRNLLDFISLASFLFPFYADEFNTMVVRIRNGENLLKAHRKHIYQLMANERGIAHWKVSVGYGIFQAVVGLSVISIRPMGLLAVIPLLGIFGLSFFAFGSFIRKSVACPREDFNA